MKVRPPLPDFFLKNLFSGLEVRDSIRESEIWVWWLRNYFFKYLWVWSVSFIVYPGLLFHLTYDFILNCSLNNMYQGY